MREKRPRGSLGRAPVHVQCEPKDNDEVGGASASSEQFCDKLRSKVGFAKTSSFQVVGLKQVKACEGNCRQIATGWVLERRKNCDTSDEGDL